LTSVLTLSCIAGNLNSATTEIMWAESVEGIRSCGGTNKSLSRWRDPRKQHVVRTKCMFSSGRPHLVQFTALRRPKLHNAKFQMHYTLEGGPVHQSCRLSKQTYMKTSPWYFMSDATQHHGNSGCMWHPITAFVGCRIHQQNSRCCVAWDHELPRGSFQAPFKLLSVYV
jgi:hypothetical protein